MFLLCKYDSILSHCILATIKNILCNEHLHSTIVNLLILNTTFEHYIPINYLYGWDIAGCDCPTSSHMQYLLQNVGVETKSSLQKQNAKTKSQKVAICNGYTGRGWGK